MVGRLELILGSMYSGKTTELIRLLSRYQSIGKNAFFINSIKDTRAPDNAILSHDNFIVPACKVEYLHQAYLKYNTDVIGIDEAQFFPDLIEFVKKKLEDNYIVIVSGLDGDYKQEKFGNILDLIPIADNYRKVHALCQFCQDGTLSAFTKRIGESKKQILIGDRKEYYAVCRKCLHNYSTNV